jgi:hypothetical protein
VGPPSQRVAARAARACDGYGPSPAQGWCSYYDGDVEAESGGQAVLAAAVCRLAGQGPGRLTTSSGEQAAFAVGEDAQPARWTWRHGRRFSPRGTTLTVPPGECVRWFVTWDLRGNDGQALPPGDYYLEAQPLVSAGATTSASMDATQRFRITG